MTMKKPRRCNEPLPSQGRNSLSKCFWGKEVLGGRKEDVVSFPVQEAHHNLCKTAPLDKHNVAIYTPGHFLLLLQLVKA